MRWLFQKVPNVCLYNKGPEIASVPVLQHCSQAKLTNLSMVLPLRLRAMIRAPVWLSTHFHFHYLSESSEQPDRLAPIVQESEVHDCYGCRCNPVLLHNES